METALKNHDDLDYKKYQTISFLEKLIDHDDYRRSILQKANIYPQFLHIYQDYNMVGTIEIAINKKSLKSLNLIIENILEKHNDRQYREQLMHDISRLMKQINLSIYDFFGRSYLEIINQSQSCKMESTLKSMEVSKFSSESLKSIKSLRFDQDQVTDVLDVEKDIIRFLKDGSFAVTEN